MSSKLINFWFPIYFTFLHPDLVQPCILDNIKGNYLLQIPIILFLLFVNLAFLVPSQISIKFSHRLPKINQYNVVME